MLRLFDASLGTLFAQRLARLCQRCRLVGALACALLQVLLSLVQLLGHVVEVLQEVLVLRDS